MAASKYLTFSVIFLGYAMFSYNRKGVSFTIPKLLSEGLKNEQVGLILSSQNLAYAISKFFGGIVSDRLSSRLLFSTGLVVSGLAAILFSLSDSMSLFVLTWFLNGLAQGLGWPAVAKLLNNWFDPTELGTWWSLASASANIVGCIAPFLASYIITSFGWRASLQFVGGLTLIAAVISLTLLQDNPKSETGGSIAMFVKKQVESQERLLKKLYKKKETKYSGNIFLFLLRSKFIWVISVSYLTVSGIKTCITDWSQVYLSEVYFHSSLVASSFISSVEFGGFLGGIAAGVLSDIHMKKRKRENSVEGNARMSIAILFSVVSSISLHLLCFNVSKYSSAIIINLIGLLIGASVYGQIALFGIVATESVISEMSGTAYAIVALTANVGSILAGLPVATLARHYSWSSVFLILEVLAIKTTAFMILTNRIDYRIKLSKQSSKKAD